MLEIIERFGKFIGRERFDDEVISFLNGMILEQDSVPAWVYFENSEKGISGAFNNNILEVIFLHGEGKDGFREFKELNGPILFSSGKAGIRRILGEPYVYKTDCHSPGNEDIWGWDKYYIQGYSLHFTYNREQEIIMITLENWS